MSDDILVSLQYLTSQIASQKSDQAQYKIGDTFTLEIDKIRVDDQVRHHFENIKELADSIKQEGQRYPLEVAKISEDRYVLVTGGRRFKAISSIGQNTAKVTLIEMPSDIGARIASQLTENLQRDDLTPLELSEAFNQLLELGWTQGKIASTLNKGRSWINRYCVLHSYPSAVKKILEDKLTADITLVGILAKVFDKSPEDFDLLVERLKNDALTRSDAKTRLDELDQTDELPDETIAPKKESDVGDYTSYHYNRPSVLIKPEKFQLFVKAKLLNGDLIKGTLLIDRYVTESSEMVWLETETGERVAVDASSVRVMNTGNSSQA